MIGRLLLALLGIIGLLGGIMLIMDGAFLAVVLGVLNAAGGCCAIIWAIVEDECHE